MDAPEKKHDEFSAEVVDAMVAEIRAQLNENDMLASLLREMAISRLHAKKSGDDLLRLQREVKLLRAKLQVRDILMPELRAQNPGVTKVKLDAGQVLPPEHGFYSLEHDGHGKAFRWTGPGNEFFFVFNLDRNASLEFTVQISLVSPEDIVKSLRCLIDMVEIPLERTKNNFAWVVRGVIPPADYVGITRLGFVVPKMFRPMDVDPYSTDGRELGVVFLDIAVSPAEPKRIREHMKAVNAASEAALRLTSDESGPESQPAIELPVQPIEPAAPPIVATSEPSPALANTDAVPDGGGATRRSPKVDSASRRAHGKSTTRRGGTK